MYVIKSHLLIWEGSTFSPFFSRGPYIAQLSISYIFSLSGRPNSMAYLIRCLCRPANSLKPTNSLGPFKLQDNSKAERLWSIVVHLNQAFNIATSSSKAAKTGPYTHSHIVHSSKFEPFVVFTMWASALNLQISTTLSSTGPPKVSIKLWYS